MSWSVHQDNLACDIVLLNHSSVAASSRRHRLRAPASGSVPPSLLSLTPSFSPLSHSLRSRDQASGSYRGACSSRRLPPNETVNVSHMIPTDNDPPIGGACTAYIEREREHDKSRAQIKSPLLSPPSLHLNHCSCFE